VDFFNEENLKLVEDINNFKLKLDDAKVIKTIQNSLVFW